MRNLSFALALFLVSTAAQAEPILPSEALRQQMLTALAAQMEALDGEGLLVRENRPKSFAQITQELQREAADARSWKDLLLTFSRLDLAYPNLHASFQPGEWFEMPARVRLKVRFTTEWTGPDSTTFRITGMDAPESGLQSGDKLVAINGRSMEEWSRENFEFCKWPLHRQCDLELPYALAREQLGWRREEPLRFTVKRNGTFFTAEVPWETQARGTRREPAPCGEDRNPYAGFTLAHQGRFACVYQSAAKPGTAILRIKTFQYLRRVGQNHPIRSVSAEVNALWPWWKKNAPKIRHLVIDVADNGGGNAPIPYYELLYDKPFQEQWVRFKKIPALDDAKLRDSLFWGTEAQEIWLRNLRAEGVWDATPWGAFLPPVPMFCAYQDRDCREGLFSVRRHGFKGNVTLVTNQYCVSSCDGFVWSIKQELGSRVRVVGQPQAADSAYSRLNLNAFLDAQGFHLQIAPQYEDPPENLLFSQTVTVTRSVSATGEIVSGRPVPVDRFVPLLYTQDGPDWRGAAVKEALRP